MNDKPNSCYTCGKVLPGVAQVISTAKGVGLVQFCSMTCLETHQQKQANNYKKSLNDIKIEMLRKVMLDYYEAPDDAPQLEADEAILLVDAILDANSEFDLDLINNTGVDDLFDDDEEDVEEDETSKMLEERLKHMDVI